MGKLRVLVVESDHEQQRDMARAVSAAGCEPLVCDVNHGLGHFFRARPDAMLAGVDPAGAVWRLLETVRESSDVPIIVSADRAANDALHRCVELRTGGLLLRPFTKDDLLRRLDAVAHSPSIDAGVAEPYERNGLRIDWASCEVTANGEPVELTKTEFRLLRHLVEHEGRVLSHDQILSEVWGPEYQGEKDRVKLYVWYLRRKVEVDPCKPALIVTKRGLGYVFAG